MDSLPKSITIIVKKQAVLYAIAEGTPSKLLSVTVEERMNPAMQSKIHLQRLMEKYKAKNSFISRQHLHPK